jgi:FKBP-type peptidyl-prolyl cis-trans isomerase 2
VRILPLLLGLALLPGCLSTGPQERDTDGDGCPDRPFGDVLHAGWPHSFNAGEPSDLVYLANSSTVGPTSLAVGANDNAFERTRGYGEGNPIAVEDLRFTPANGTLHFGALRIPADTSPRGLVATWRILDPTRPAPCQMAGGLTSNWAAIETEGEAESAQPGQGAHVWYAGFWENGTLFDTNLEDLDLGSGWPKAGWYEGGHWEPIPVYVYDQDRSEQPAHWKSPFSGTPAAGSPADEQAGAGYFTTIKGFNEAVKGLPVGTRQIFHIAPEDAYTQAGREDHLLYGDALVFLVEVEDVVDAPCPTPPAVGGGCSNVAQSLQP